MTRPLPAVVVKGSADVVADTIATISTPLSPRRQKSAPDNNDKVDERKTNIQVCVRLRPILPSDSSSGSASAGGRESSPAAARRKSRLPTPTKNKMSGISRKSSIPSASPGAHFARTTQSSQRRVDDEEDDDLSSKVSNLSVSSASTLIPAWEVASSALHDNTTDDTIYQNPATNPDPARKSSYAFDRVFGPSNRTSSIYSTSVADVVRATMEGYHGSVFAYGQTSTGKTHTMTGTPSDPGIVPLAVRDCFRYIRSEEDADDNREYLLRVSYMEIYNEQINDLLAPPPVPGPRGPGSSGIGGGPSSIRIFESKAEGVVVRGLKEEIVTSPEQVFGLLATGEARRRTGSTALNRASSRSHSIFRLIIESRARKGPRILSSVASGMDSSPARSRCGDDDSSVGTGASISTAGGTAAAGGPVRVSSLSLVDLAGSESVKATGSTGARQKEGQYINKSLMTLGHVIYKLSELSAKAEKGGSGVSANMQMSTKHIPYRDSKLTRLLQPSLSGNAQICIVCNVSPLTRNLEESHNTLKFATRAKRIKQNASVNEVVDDRTLLQNYREEIEALKAQLRQAKEAQAALEKEKEAAPAPLDENDEDITMLVGAIQNLEKLILRKASVKHDTPGGGNVKQRKRSSKGGLDGNGSFFASGNFESLLAEGDDDEGDEVPSTRRDLNKTAFSANIDNDANENGNADEEQDGLITELHRIQGLLGSVLKKGRPGTSLPEVLSPVAENTAVSTPSRPTANGGSMQNTPNRDEEVEQLRSQLKEQEVATSLRKADSSFLQSQLQEKDSLLKEVSKILDAVEKRQVELEEDNARMKRELSQKTLVINSQANQIAQLQQQASAQEDDDLFDTLVG